MAKKNKMKKFIHADSIDVVSEKYQNEKAETKKHKNDQELNIETLASDTPFYLKHRIHIFTLTNVEIKDIIDRILAKNILITNYSKKEVLTAAKMTLRNIILLLQLLNY